MQNESSTSGESRASSSGPPSAPEVAGTGATAAPTDSPVAAHPGGTSSVAHTRTAVTWIGLVLGALVLIVLLVFIVQNNSSTRFSIFFWDFTLPLGVSMLFAAIAGALIMALVGGARILQLRKAYRRKTP